MGAREEEEVVRLGEEELGAARGGASCGMVDLGPKLGRGEERDEEWWWGKLQMGRVVLELDSGIRADRSGGEFAGLGMRQRREEMRDRGLQCLYRERREMREEMEME